MVALYKELEVAMKKILWAFAFLTGFSVLSGMAGKAGQSPGITTVKTKNDVSLKSLVNNLDNKKAPATIAKAETAGSVEVQILNNTKESLAMDLGAGGKCQFVASLAGDKGKPCMTADKSGSGGIASDRQSTIFVEKSFEKIGKPAYLTAGTQAMGTQTVWKDQSTSSGLVACARSGPSLGLMTASKKGGLACLMASINELIL